MAASRSSAILKPLSRLSTTRPSAIGYHSGGMEPYSIGVDLGGTNLRAAAVDEKGKVLERVSVPANFHAGPISRGQ